MSNTKPREFWITMHESDLTGKTHPLHSYERIPSEVIADEIVHVVENSAYQAALEEIEKLKDDYKSAMACCEKVSEQHKEIENLRAHLLSECKNHKETFAEVDRLKAKVAKYEEALQTIIVRADKSFWSDTGHH